jgi:hypothetical protein
MLVSLPGEFVVAGKREEERLTHTPLTALGKVSAEQRCRTLSPLKAGSGLTPAVLCPTASERTSAEIG